MIQREDQALIRGTDEIHVCVVILAKSTGKAHSQMHSFASLARSNVGDVPCLIERPHSTFIPQFEPRMFFERREQLSSNFFRPAKETVLRFGVKVALTRGRSIVEAHCSC
jgi:hypothetical protein